jgi:hypothetical protein
MTKPKIVCVMGSAVASPVTYAVAVGLMAMVFRLFLTPPLLPEWLKWVLFISMLTLVPWQVYDLYRWFFRKCYRPSLLDSAGEPR